MQFQVPMTTAAMMFFASLQSALPAMVGGGFPAAGQPVIVGASSAAARFAAW
jgi:hypothetical protein